MIKVNLFPWRKQLVKQRAKRLYLHFLLAALMAVLFAGLWQWVSSSQLSTQKLRVSFLQQKNDELALEVKTVNSLELERQQLLQQLSIIAQLEKNRALTATALNDMPKVIPDGVVLTSWQRKANNMLLSGRAQSHDSVTRFLSALNGLSWAKKATITEIKSNNDGNKNGLISFTITIALSSTVGA
jgi:type IV pilus assembly protein PilN